MNLQESIQYSELKVPVRKIEPKKRSSLEVAKRVFQLAANGGFPYKKQTPEGWAKKWLSSSEFTLMEIDINAAANLNINAVASPHKPKNPNRVQHYVHCSVDSLDPIVVDTNKRGVGRSYLGYVPQVIVLDGKHRKMSQIQNGRTKILAWVGAKAQKKLEQLRKVARVVDAASENIFLPPVEPTKMAATYELHASTVPAIIKAGGPGSGRHSEGGDPRGFAPSRKEMGSYEHFDYNNKSGTFTCNHCKENSYSNIDDMYKHLQTEHKGSVHATGGPGATSLGTGSGSNPALMKTTAIKAELKSLVKNHSMEASILKRTRLLASELKKRVEACGARSSGSLEEGNASDDKVPPDASDDGSSVEPSDRLKWDGDKPNNYAPGTGPGYTDQFGQPPLMAPGAGVGPRVPNKGASRSDLRRVEAGGPGSGRHKELADVMEKHGWNKTVENSAGAQWQHSSKPGMYITRDTGAWGHRIPGKISPAGSSGRGPESLESHVTGTGNRESRMSQSMRYEQGIKAGKKIKSKKVVDRIYQEEDSSMECESCGKMHATAPPGREEQVLKLKEKYGEDSAIPFKIAWSQYHGKDEMNAGGPGSGRHKEFGQFKRTGSQGGYTHYSSPKGNHLIVTNTHPGYPGKTVVLHNQVVQHTGDKNSANNFVNQRYGLLKG